MKEKLILMSCLCCGDREICDATKINICKGCNNGPMRAIYKDE
jgi:hypothetical protein